MKPLPSSVAARLFQGLRKHPLASGLVLIALIAVWFQLRTHEVPKEVQRKKYEPLQATHFDPRTMPPDHPQSTMSPAVNASLGFVGGLSLEARVRELMEISGPLSGNEIEEAFRAMLALPAAGESIAQHATWFHELANLLQCQKLDLRAFSEVLATVVRNSSQDLATRDYGLQHLNRVWGKAEGNPDLRHSIEATLEATATTRNPLRATALLNLHLLDPTGRRGVDATALVEGVKTILSDSTSTGEEVVRSRMVAARIAGERHLDESRGPLLRLATSESEHALVRMAAISALGKLADRTDMKTLATLSSKDPRVMDAIRHAADLAGGQ